jgi:hypothetical protein
MPKTAVARSLVNEDSRCNLSLLAKLFGIARSSLHHTPVRKKKDDISHKELKTLHTEHPWYGHRRIAWTLGWSLGKTRRLMKVFSISALVKKSRRWTKSEDV